MKRIFEKVRGKAAIYPAIALLLLIGVACGASEEPAAPPAQAPAAQPRPSSSQRNPPSQRRRQPSPSRHNRRPRPLRLPPAVAAAPLNP